MKCLSRINLCVMTYITLFRNFLRLFTLYFLKKDVDFLRFLFRFFSCISPSISWIHFYVALCLSGVSTFGIWCWGTKSRWCWRSMETSLCLVSMREWLWVSLLLEWQYDPSIYSTRKTCSVCTWRPCGVRNVAKNLPYKIIGLFNLSI